MKLGIQSRTRRHNNLDKKRLLSLPRKGCDMRTLSLKLVKEEVYTEKEKLLFQLPKIRVPRDRRVRIKGWVAKYGRSPLMDLRTA